MTDPIDRAQELEEAHRAAALERHAQRPARASLRPVGACYYCGEAVLAGRLFCDTECGWAWEDEHRTREAQGFMRNKP